MDWLTYEHALYAQGLGQVCGVDEAGRGPLAGPVFAAAVILPHDRVIDGVNDSKKLSEKKREALFACITEQALAYAVASADEQEIAAHNILGASLLAMRRAVSALQVPAQAALVDGNRDPNLSIPTTCVVGGDAQCACIAAASILAKVSRDRYMLELDAKYPQYGFAKHKGYPTRAHYEAILQYGPSPVHRLYFLRNLEEKRRQYAGA
ncbi:MAG: ribonuclease HII [Ethanoligenens sp.]|uniref:ribonuclease HII n=1 Tax=Ethanoligenens sp. TaxID=2099655 RepID=UPI0039E8E44B